MIFVHRVMPILKDGSPARKKMVGESGQLIVYFWLVVHGRFQISLMQ